MGYKEDFKRREMEHELYWEEMELREEARRKKERDLKEMELRQKEKLKKLLEDKEKEKGNE